ncbi:serine/threonine-protein kinase [Streptomyces shenzhenensis]|uniref:Serine/threonine protein kinase n=1 Tax=Streptomyces shenzhenensis TaxID=943815 RepID=A0A3M0HZU0_9ACTN|nr:serine/threonine-protein kinase [Streptomyces shenzhenensis]RMB82205.1 serine/threonine protein kinase [Streptomyces shenzhenensis]
MQPLAADEPTAVGPYRLLGRLGSGGMGRVYLGRSTGGRTVAVKIVHPHFALDEEFRARFRREVDAARRVGGAWTAPVLDADPDAPVPWVATGYVAGPSLAAAVAAHGPLPQHSVRTLGAGLAEALAAVHELGLVHRDVKPPNVLLTLDGPLLIDFGIARATDGTASLTSTGVSIGSPGYMSPEQILGKGVTGAADVFSLGAVLAFAATGAPPFPGDSSAALLYKVVHEEPELGALHGELRQVAAACLAKEPGARPAPGAVAGRLAPDGAARLVAGGWLPGPLVEQVSRDAVRLLGLETTDPAPSGPVAFSSPSVTGRTEAPAGEFGPPPVMPGAAAGAGTGIGPGVAVGAGASGGFGAGAGGLGGGTGGVPGPRDAVPGEQRPGKVSVTMAATSAPGAGGRGRRMSCTVALAVAGALAAVTVGLGFLLRPLIGGDGAHDTAGAGTKPPTASTGSGDAGPAPGSGVLAPYLGTWQGQATALDGQLPIGTFRLTVRSADVGEELGRLRQTDQLGGVCTDLLTLKQVTATALVATSVGAEDNHAGCNPDPHTIRLTPVGDDLTYTSDSTAEGNPTSRMSRTD